MLPRRGPRVFKLRPLNRLPTSIPVPRFGRTLTGTRPPSQVVESPAQTNHPALALADQVFTKSLVEEANY